MDVCYKLISIAILTLIGKLHSFGIPKDETQIKYMSYVIYIGFKPDICNAQLDRYG